MNRNKVAMMLVQKGILPIRIVGISMYPALEKGNQYYCEKKDEYCIGDIVLIRLPDGEQMTHRLIAIRGDKYITKGDNWYYADTPSTKDDIIASVILQEKDKEWIVKLSCMEAYLCRVLPARLHYGVKKWKRKILQRVAKGGPQSS